MTFASATQTQGHSDNATFRTWGLATSNLLTTVGVTKTDDTGQIDWSTVNRPSNSVTAGYEIRKITNAVDGDIYIKLVWTSSGVYGGSVFITMTVGTGSNGSGTLTGVYGSGVISAYTGNSYQTSLTTGTIYAAADDNGFIFAAHPSVTSSYGVYQHFLFVDRLRDSYGGASGNGIVWGGNGGNTGGSSVYLWSDNLVSAGHTSSCGALGGDQSATNLSPNYGYPYFATQPSVAVGGVVPVAIYEHLTPAVNYYKMFVITNHADATTGTPISADILGTPRQYVSMGPLVTYLDNAADAGPNNRLCIAMLGE